MNKNELRKEMIAIRKNINDKKEISTIIVNKIRKLDIYKKARVVAIYNSMNDEVATNSFYLDNKIILLPRVVNDNLVFIKIDNDTKYDVSKFRVIEPIINNNIYTGKIDLIIVPGVAFDKNFNRLGYGKGYYDHYLVNQDIYKIGICFDSQLVHEIIVDDYDIKMDMIVTEKRLIKKGF